MSHPWASVDFFQGKGKIFQGGKNKLFALKMLKNILYSFKKVEKHTTVKLGYNELGYNEHSVMTSDFFSPKWLFYYINQPGYNETRL